MIITEGYSGHRGRGHLRGPLRGLLGLLAAATMALALVGGPPPAGATPPPSATVAGWGSGSKGELGNGGNTSSNVPVAATGGALTGKSITQVAAGRLHTCALTTDGIVACWGDNVAGQLGNGGNVNSNLPVAVDVAAGSALFGKSVASISAYLATTCAVTTEGRVVCWGDNSSGQLGDGTRTSANRPVAVSTGIESALINRVVTSVAVGGHHACALTESAKIACWGSNGLGQAGVEKYWDALTGWVNFVPTPTFIYSSDKYLGVSAGLGHTCAVTDGNVAQCWGWGSSGQLGDGVWDKQAWPTPVDVGDTSALKGQPVASVSSGDNHTCAVTTAGNAACWGFNLHGELGNGANTDTSVPVAVTTGGALATGAISRVTAGESHTCALKKNSTAACWGFNQWYGELGDGTNTDSNVPVNVSLPGGKSGLRPVTSLAAGGHHVAAVFATTAPSAPTINFADGGDKFATITFTPPIGDGGVEITNYEYSIDGQPWTARSPESVATPWKIEGLENGKTYSVAIRAVNAVGPGAASAPVNVTPTAPVVYTDAPTKLVATPGDGSATITFVAPSWTKGAFIKYQYLRDNGSIWQDVASGGLFGPVVINNLTNGTTTQIRLRVWSTLGAGTTSEPVSVTPVASQAGYVFVPLTPARVVDTRVSQGGAGPLAPGEGGMRTFSVASTQLGGVPVVPLGAVAIVYNITVPNPPHSGHVRVMPGDAATLTTASAANFRPGETIANSLTTRIDSQRRIKVYASAATDVIVDVVGYFAPESPTLGANSPQTGQGRFTPITPRRVYDPGPLPTAWLAPGQSRLVSVATALTGGATVVPVGATAVAYNITVVRPEGAGHLRVMPGHVLTSPTSSINWSRAGDVIANGLAVQVDGQRQIRVANGGTSAVRFLIDIAGYYSSTGALFYPKEPTRVFDSRVSQRGTGPVTPGEAGQRSVSVANAWVGGVEQVPLGATAIAYNLTVAGTTQAGHLRLFPAGTPLVDASAINWPGVGYSRANGSVVGISPERKVTMHNGSTGPAEAIIDTLGYYK